MINLFKPLTNDWKKEIKDAKPFQHQRYFVVASLIIWRLLVYLFFLNNSAVCLHFSRLRASVKKSLLKPVVQEKKDVQNSNSNHERDIYLKEVCML